MRTKKYATKHRMVSAFSQFFVYQTASFLGLMRMIN